MFLLAGSLQPDLGGAVVAHAISLTDLQTRVNEDPFVAENVVSAEILEISPARADARLAFLLIENRANVVGPGLEPADQPDAGGLFSFRCSGGLRPQPATA